MGNRRMATSIRIRLCRVGMTVDQLAGMIEALKVPARQPVERLASMKRRSFGDPQISQDGIRRAPLLKPVGGSLESSLNKRSGASKRVTAGKSQVRTAARKSSRPRRRAVRSRSAYRYNRIQHYSASGAPLAPARVAPQRGRFLAPVKGVAPAPSSAAVDYKPTRGVSLPPEAYRGPQAN